MNVCSFVGNLGSDVDTRYFESGKCKSEFSLAISMGKEKPPLWMKCEAWERIAETAANYLRKGSKVAVSGSLEQDSWTDKLTGEKRQRQYLRVSSLTLCDSRQEQPAAQPVAQSTPTAQPAPAPVAGYDDIPF